MPLPKWWYIIVGRLWGADEASSLAVHAVHRDDAIEQFEAYLRPGNLAAPSDDEEGPGTVYIDALYYCGSQEPDLEL